MTDVSEYEPSSSLFSAKTALFRVSDYENGVVSQDMTDEDARHAINALYLEAIAEALVCLAGVFLEGHIYTRPDSR